MKRRLAGYRGLMGGDLSRYPSGDLGYIGSVIGVKGVTFKAYLEDRKRHWGLIT